MADVQLTPREASAVGKGGERRPERGVEAANGVALAGNGPLDALEKAGGEVVEEGNKDAALVWEMEVERPFGGVRGADDVVDNGGVVALVGEDGAGSV